MDTQYICNKCLNFDSIRKFIETNKSDSICSYCNRSNRSTAPKNSIFNHIVEVLNEYIVPLSAYPTLKGFFYNAHEDLTVYSNSYDFLQWYEQGISEVIFEDLIDFLDEKVFSKGLMINYVDSYRYDESLESHSNKWDSLVKEFSHLYRYQTTSISSFLNSILQPLLKDNLIKSRHIETFTKNKRLYRSRICQNQDTLDAMMAKAYAELGATPLNFSSEQRMSAQGISSFYCSTQRKTCLPEIRPVVGDKAITGAFKPIFNLKLLKLKDLKNMTLNDIDFHSDPFDFNIPLKIESTRFLSKLYQELIKPSSLKDPMTYRITQLFVEMLRTNFIKQIHGITFPSVQAGGRSKNIVLFPEFSVTSNHIGDIYNPYEKVFSQNNYHDSKITLDKSTFRPSLVFEEGSLIMHSVKSIKIVTEDIQLNI